METAILDVAIGLMMTFLIMSMVATIVQEIIANILNLRANTLKKGLKSLLDDPNTQGLVDMIYDSAPVRSISTSKSGPTHIPSARFAEGLVEALENFGGMSGAAKGPLAPLVRRAGDDVEAFKKEAAAWFNDAMEDVSGWYKAKAQYILLGIGFAIAVLFNISTISIGQALWTQPTLREAVVAQATAYARQHADTPPTDESIRALEESLDSLGLPIGWTESRLNLVGLGEVSASDPGSRTLEPMTVKAWILEFGAMLFGWVLTALATSLGSQFWFDTLGKTLTLRAAITRQVRNAGGSGGTVTRGPSGASTIPGLTDTTDEPFGDGDAGKGQSRKKPD